MNKIPDYPTPGEYRVNELHSPRALTRTQIFCSDDRFITNFKRQLCFYRSIRVISDNALNPILFFLLSYFKSRFRNTA